MDGNELLRPVVTQATADVLTYERSRRRLDVAGLALLVVGIVCGGISYLLITEHGLNPLILVPPVVAATTGVSHITKREAPMYNDGGLVKPEARVFIGGEPAERVLPQLDYASAKAAGTGNGIRFPPAWSAELAAHFRRPTVRLRRAWRALRGRP